MNYLKNALDEGAMSEAKENWRRVMKPLGSLGRFEQMIVRMAGIYGRADFDIKRRCVLVACADNGVVAENISQSDSSVTSVVAEQIALGRSNINAMAGAVGADVYAIDFGMKNKATGSRVIDMSVAMSTADIMKGPAMSAAQAAEAIDGGRSLIKSMRHEGYDIFVTGEMGIGNTTTASAIASLLLDVPPAKVTGRGAGLDDERLVHKAEVITRAIEVNAPDKNDGMDVLRKMGGFDIAAMAGMYIGGMENRVPVIMDGFISSVAALIAVMIEPGCRDFMIPSHASSEPGSMAVMERLKMEPVIRADMRLGEGTGGVCLLPLLDAALADYRYAHKFGDTEVEQYVEF